MMIKEKIKTGTLYGVGVGPGDPELMTMKAFKVLSSSGAVAVPRASDSSSDGMSQALLIVKKAIDLNDKKILQLLFPMTKDKAVLKESRQKAVEEIAEELKAGQDVAFITLGDPMLYSTFSYLVPLLKEILPEAEVKTIPGVTSFSAGMSSAALPLAESNEKVIIIPAAYDVEEVKEHLKSFDTLVLMKVNRIFDKLLDLLVELGLEENSIFISRVGWPEEKIVTDIKSLKGQKLDYFSMVIVKRNINER
ncbi:MAG: precorrin-2 C(20)-methyltransferase [Deltaproteobacteria bacterium]|nr:precorrin-2 C(20)-methyltransferase [Deltaproteobacteria bacterium]